MLRWDTDQHGAMANSRMTDDGDAFTYEFARSPGGFENKSAEELTPGIRPTRFNDLTAAKAWAEKNETTLMRSLRPMAAAE